MQRIDFNKLDTVALKRYRRFHKLDDVGPNPTKEELVSAVGKHFTAQVITYLPTSHVLSIVPAAACAVNRITWHQSLAFMSAETAVCLILAYTA